MRHTRTIGQRLALLVCIGSTSLGLLSVVGCADKLETGYEPKKLGVTPAARRAYYATPFSPEAGAAQQEQGNSSGPTSGAPGRPYR